MNRRTSYLLGLASLGLVLAMPAAADHGSAQAAYAAGAYVLAKRGDEAKSEVRRETREDFRGRDRNVQDREFIRNSAPSEYGYGYERRQQPRHDERSHDERGRR